jgi:hypothetical protein
MKPDLEFQGVLASVSKINLPDNLKQGLQRLLTELGSLGENFQGELEKISKDPRYTMEGKKLLKQELGSSLMEKLAMYENPYREHLGRAEKKLFGGNPVAKTDLERILDHLKNAELRQLYDVGNMDEIQIQDKATDPDFVQAILSSPKSLISEDLKNKLLRQKAKAASPEISQELDQLNFANKTVMGFIKTLESHVKASGWKDKDEITL